MGSLIDQSNISMGCKTGGKPGDTAVTRDGDLVYTNYSNKTVNLVKNKETRTVITVQGWGPLNVCYTASGDILVAISDVRDHTKVVRYSGSTEKQIIQFGDHGFPLYSSAGTKHVSENRNLDICVAVCRTCAVLVVNASGILQFKYTGQSSDIEGSFSPVGLTTDSQSHILIADTENHRIHILNQVSHFLRYIHCDLNLPWGLCVDIRDNLIVTYHGTAKVKRIHYL
jgi:hypothetical protein